MTCPRCSGAAIDVLESRLCANGTRRRRYACLDCTYRWTIWDGPRPRRGHAPGSGPTNRRRSPLLSPDQVRLALTSSLSCAVMGQQLGCSKAAISQIRRGQIHTDLWPELPRTVQRAQPPNGAPSCDACSSWRDGQCRQGIPDPIQEGPAFAADCDLYSPIQ